MSIANLKGGDVDCGKVITEEIEGADYLLTPIKVVGGLDFNLTGSVEGLLAVETDALNSRSAKVADLSGQDLVLNGAVRSLTGAGSIMFGLGVPSMDTTPGSVFIRTDGTSSAEVVYVNHDGSALSWSALS